jgi:hypothetical protein
MLLKGGEGVSHLIVNCKSLIRIQPLRSSALPVKGTKADLHEEIQYIYAYRATRSEDFQDTHKPWMTDLGFIARIITLSGVGLILHPLIRVFKELLIKGSRL